jgi:protein AaeX
LIRDYYFYGVYVHPYMLALFLSFIVIRPLGLLLNRLNVYRHVWHAGLFDTALFIILFGVFVSLLVPDFVSCLLA